MTWAQAEQFLIPFQLIFIMLGMGSTLSVDDFRKIVRYPVSLAVGLGVQVVLIPLLGFGFVQLFRLDSSWALGIILITAVPGGAFSNLLTFFARGNVALSVSITAITSIGCVVTFPLIIKILAGGHLASGVSLPFGRTMLEVLCYLVLPVIAGMVVYRRASAETAKRVSMWCVRISVAFIIAIAVGSLWSKRIRVEAYGWTPPMLILLFGIVMHLGASQTCRWLGLADEDTAAAAIEVSVRNIGLGLLPLKYLFVPGSEAYGHALYSLLFYAGISMFMAFPVVILHRSGRGVFALGARRPRASQHTDHSDI